MSQIKKAMILAAGKGKRLQPITNTLPKSLVKVGGIPLIDYSLTHLKNAGIQDIIINVHYKAEQVLSHLKDEKNITIVREDHLLESGGSIKNVLPFFERSPFFVLNSDVVFIDLHKNLLKRMQDAWDPLKMDILQCLIPFESTLEYPGTGDFSASYIPTDPTTEAFALEKLKNAPWYIYGGIQIYKPELFENHPGTVFTPTQIYTEALAKKKLYGLLHKGTWLHIGTPQELNAANKWFEEQNDLEVKGF